MRNKLYFVYTKSGKGKYVVANSRNKARSYVSRAYHIEYTALRARWYDRMPYVELQEGIIFNSMWGNIGV